MWADGETVPESTLGLRAPARVPAVLARWRCFGCPGPERAEQAVLARRRGEGSDQVCARFLRLASHVAGESAADNAGEIPQGWHAGRPASPDLRAGPGWPAPASGAPLPPPAALGLLAALAGPPGVARRAVVPPLSRAGATPRSEERSVG